MYTNEYRPLSFADVVGQDQAVKILKSITKNPDRAPRSLLIHGPYGTGKTTLARLFGRALVCESFGTTGDVCHKCPPCSSFGKTRSSYIEYDSSVTGNVASIKELQPVIDHIGDGLRVLVFDECHVASAAAQSALLKMIEEGPQNTFFLFATTEMDKVLKTIQSRSLPIELFSVDVSEMLKRLRFICKSEHLDIEDEILQQIALKADGHMRDAVMTLNGYALSGDKDLVSLAIDEIREFMTYVAIGAEDQALKSLAAIMKYPIAQTHRSMNFVMMRTVEAAATRDQDSLYAPLAKSLGKAVFKLLKLVSDPWVQTAFKDEYLTYSFFLTLIKMGKQSPK